jgi:thiamine-phosphate pyrophosphorylase
MIDLPRLYAVADGAFGDPVRLAMELFEGGVRLVQIRHKNATSRMLMDEVESVLKGAPPNVHVIVNDRTDVARLVGASGVHLGQEDLSPYLARVVLREQQVIGLSTHDPSQAMEAERAPVDYVAAGPVFATTTKQDAFPVLGLDRLREICSTVRKPVVAIGGITLESAREVLDCGAASVAVISDLLRHGSVADRARVWVRHLES